jgi:hypothetical protein
MRYINRIIVASLTAFLLAAAVSIPDARENTGKSPLQIQNLSKTSERSLRYDSRFSQTSAQVDTFVLASFSFENGWIPSPQGWTTHDRTAQLDTFWHVASGVELNGGSFGRLNVLEGNKSMWCGVAPGGHPETCYWATLPGYGNQWDQRFTSISFPRTGDVELSYIIAWDSEYANYDITVVCYKNKDDEWTPLFIEEDGRDWYDWIGGPRVDTFTIPDSLLGPSIQVRFRFTSDGAWSDQDGNWPTDGAVIIDSLTLRDESGVLSFQDFETELDGAHSTNDGHWQASGPLTFGDFGALFSGAALLQEDECAVNASTMWGFFNGSPDDYECGGHPEQAAVPFSIEGETASQWDDLYIDNEIWSPFIDWTHDQNGTPVPSTANVAYLEFDVYKDLPLENLVFYTWHVRGVVGGCARKWQDNNRVYYGGEKEWFRHRAQVAEYIVSGATEVQLALNVLDMCPWFCPYYGDGSCHSHAPLFDNVRLIRTTAIGPQWNVDPAKLFQDNFAEDGTTTGTVRMDNTLWLPGISTNDRAYVSIFAPDTLDSHIPGDPGSGPAVYCHVADVSPAKSGAAVSGDAGLYPVVSTGGGWTVLRCNGTAGKVSAEYSIDLNDNLYTPGDTVYYYFSARDAAGITTYWSTPAGTATTEAAVQMMPDEVTCLPANALVGATDILYIDDFDDLGEESVFESAFEFLGITPDRYDVRASAGYNMNGPGSRVVNVSQQLIDCYRKIIWHSGYLSYYTIGDGRDTPSQQDLADDFSMLLEFLDQHPGGAGLYISGDNIAEEWETLTASSPVTLRSTYMNFNLLSGDHQSVGQPVSPLVIGRPGSPFENDSLIAHGACPTVSNFDVLEPAGASELAMTYSGSPAHGAVLTQVTPNAAGDTARVMLSGVSYHDIRDDRIQEPIDRVAHLLAVLRWLNNSIGDPTAVAVAPPLANELTQNYPNPFNPTTTIHYSIVDKGRVTLKVYDVMGQLVTMLVDEEKNPGTYMIQWDGRNHAGNSVASGVYFYKLVSENFSNTKKLILLK